MTTEPKVKGFLDEEEKGTIEAIEKPEYSVDESFLNSGRMEELRAAARMTIAEERTRISLRVPKSDLSKLKAQAMREGVGYQTLINSILHKAVTKVG